MSKFVWIAEKPAVGEIVAKVLGGGTRKATHYECGDNIVTWAFGHLIKSQPPEKYNPSYKNWDISDLPLKLFPTVYEPIAGKESQVSFIGQALKKAQVVYNMCDIDDEGSLIFEELMIFHGWKGETRRVLISDMNDSAVLKAVKNHKDNRDFYGQYLKAYARSAGDEIFGLSMTRALTVAAKSKGYNGSALTVGRVQTPTLGLVCKRYLEHKAHTKSFYYTLTIDAKCDSGGIVKASLIPSDKFTVNEDGKITNDGILKSVSRLIDKSEGSVSSLDVADHKKAAPLPYNLARLQQAMNKKYKFTAQKTLDLTQALRENHKAITYNRSDCSYLSEEQHAEAPLILDALKKHCEYSGLSFDHNIKSKAFNDKNITAHTAIIPTGRLSDAKGLSDDERKVYIAICNNYVAQFMPEKVVKSASGVIRVMDYDFKFSGNKTVVVGWGAIFDEDKEGTDSDEQLSDMDHLLSLSVGDTLIVDKATVNQKETAPPKLFTEASLLSAMTRIADFVENEKIKKLLKQKDDGVKGEHGSIGTPATRSAIIERLKKSGYIEVVKGNLIPTENALTIINTLPRSITNPDLTALWFQQQNLIAENKLSVDEFVENIYSAISEEVSNLSSADFTGLVSEGKKAEDIIYCPNCNSQAKLYPKLLACKNPAQSCDFKIWRTISQKELTDKQLIALTEKGETGYIKGFVSKKGSKYEAKLLLKDKKTGALEFQFKPKN